MPLLASAPDIVQIPGLSTRTSNVTLTIVIIMHNAADYSAKCIESIYAHTHVDFSIHALDNGSSDHTREWLQNLPEDMVDRYYSDKNLGAPGGRNYLLSRIPLGQYVVFLDNDCEVFEGWDKIILNELQDSSIGAVGHAGWFLQVFPRNRVVIPPKDPKATCDVDVLTGYCMAMRREAMQECGLLDEGYGLYLFEDDDYCLRIKLAGYRVLGVPRIPVVHHTHRSSSTVSRILKLGYSLEKQRYFGNKWYGKAKLEHKFSLFTVGACYLREGLLGLKDICKTQWTTWRNGRQTTKTTA